MSNVELYRLNGKRQKEISNQYISIQSYKPSILQLFNWDERKIMVTFHRISFAEARFEKKTKPNVSL